MRLDFQELTSELKIESRIIPIAKRIGSVQFPDALHRKFVSRVLLWVNTIYWYSFFCILINEFVMDNKNKFLYHEIYQHQIVVVHTAYGSRNPAAMTQIADTGIADVFSMDLEELMNTKVTIATKTNSP